MLSRPWLPNGVVMLANHGGVYLGDPLFGPVFDELPRPPATRCNVGPTFGSCCPHAGGFVPDAPTAWVRRVAPRRRRPRAVPAAPVLLRHRIVQPAALPSCSPSPRPTTSPSAVWLAARPRRHRRLDDPPVRGRRPRHRHPTPDRPVDRGRIVPPARVHRRGLSQRTNTATRCTWLLAIAWRFHCCSTGCTRPEASVARAHSTPCPARSACQVHRHEHQAWRSGDG